ncbi:MAG: hypothetical protein NTZ83_02260 [Candidatus Pacearchaeota archaeon]|nr:hypothetical protein [Candidatus Pacearchaeota archaeon]
MAIKLPEFKGYTVDVRLKQFRKVTNRTQIEFIDFDTEKGDQLLGEYIASLDLNKKSDKDILNAIWR